MEGWKNMTQEKTRKGGNEGMEATWRKERKEHKQGEGGSEGGRVGIHSN